MLPTRTALHLQKGQLIGIVKIRSRVDDPFDDRFLLRRKDSVSQKLCNNGKLRFSISIGLMVSIMLFLLQAGKVKVLAKFRFAIK